MNTLVSLLFCLLFAFSGFSRSQTIHFNQPNIQIVLEPGLTCSISWRVDHTGLQHYTHVDLFLMQFIFDRFYVVEPIAYNVDVDTPEPIEWQIPYDDILDGQYVISAVALGCNYKSYSDYFWILHDYSHSPSSRSRATTYEIVIEKPAAHSVYRANELCLIRWNRFEAEPLFTHVDIHLVFGSKDSYKLVSTLAHNFDITHKHFVRFITPERCFSEGNYLILFKAIGADYETFSPEFKIVS